MTRATAAEPRLARIGPWLALALLVASAFVLDDKLVYSPDSWALFELSKTVFGGDFYAVHHIRSFEQIGAYSSAFPPLWPLLIAILDGLTGLGARSGFVLSVISSMLFAVASETYGRRAFGLRWIGLTAATLMFVFAGFGEEVLAGRTIPLQLALYAAVLAVVARGKHEGRRGLLAGALLGLAVLNRFDALPVAILFVPLAAIVLRPRLSFHAGYATAFFVTISPWIAYSRLRFGTWFKSDNSAIALSVEPRHVAEWFARPPVTASDAPAAWLLKVVENGVAMVGHFFASLNAAALIGLLSVLVILVWQGAGRAHSSDRPALRTFAFGPLLMMLTLCGYVVTGYFDDRYFAPLWWVLILVLLALSVLRLPDERRDGATALAAYAAMLFAMVFAVVTPARTLPTDGYFPGKAGDAQLRQCLRGREGELILMSDHREAARLSALYDYRTLILPLNIDRLSDGDIAIFLKRYPVRIYAFTDGDTAPANFPTSGRAPIPGCPSGWFQQMVNPSVVPRRNDVAAERNSVNP